MCQYFEFGKLVSDVIGPTTWAEQDDPSANQPTASARIFSLTDHVMTQPDADVVHSNIIAEEAILQGDQGQTTEEFPSQHL